MNQGKVCQGTYTYTSDADLTSLYTGGFITGGERGNESVFNAALAASPTGILPAVTILTNITLPPRPGMYNTDGEIAKDNVKAIIDDDKDLSDKMQKEYCHYLQRYQYALNEFLVLATKADPSDADKTKAQTLLDAAKTMNRRVNMMINIMNAVAVSRVDGVNNNVTHINAANSKINSELSNLNATYSVISNQKALMNTRAEMIRYTIEKNNHMVNQVSLWAGLNILALGTIFWMYRNL